MIGLSVRAVGALMLGLWSVIAGRADSAAEFTRGRTVEFYVGYSPGGGYDIYARMLARHMGRFIPGNPTLLPKNMEGAGSLRLPHRPGPSGPPPAQRLGRAWPA